MSPNGSWVAFDYLQSIDSYSDPGGSFASSRLSTQWPGEHQRTLRMEPSEKELAFQWQFSPCDDAFSCSPLSLLLCHC